MRSASAREMLQLIMKAEWMVCGSEGSEGIIRPSRLGFWLVSAHIDR